MTDEQDGCVLVIAGRKVTLDRAEEFVRKFPVSTILNYDLGGDRWGWPTPSDGLTLTDLGRAAFLDGEISGTEAARVLEASEQAPSTLWERVPPWATLEMADPACPSGLYDHALALYDHFFKVRGIDPAKASKLLHLKRPSLFPILDTKVTDLYRATGAPAAAAKANHRSREWKWKEVFWDVIREDLIANQHCLGELHQRCVVAAVHDEQAALLARIGPLRVLSVIASQMRPARTRSSS